MFMFHLDLVWLFIFIIHFTALFYPPKNMMRWQFFPFKKLSEAWFKNTTSRTSDNSGEEEEKKKRQKKMQSDVPLTSSSVCQPSALALA